MTKFIEAKALQTKPALSSSNDVSQSQSMSLQSPVPTDKPHNDELQPVKEPRHQDVVKKDILTKHKFIEIMESINNSILFKPP